MMENKSIKELSDDEKETVRDMVRLMRARQTQQEK